MDGRTRLPESDDHRDQGRTSAGSAGLGRKNIRAGAEASLKRLGVDRIDLYYAHADDLNTPIDETLREFDALVREGKVGYIAASNFTAARLAAALATSAREGLARYVALQPHYNLMVRNEYEGALSDVCAREGVACVPYFALAMGFLTGKYRPGITVDSARAEGAQNISTHGARGALRARRHRCGASHDRCRCRPCMAARPVDGRGADCERANRRATRGPAAAWRRRCSRLMSRHGWPIAVARRDPGLSLEFTRRRSLARIEPGDSPFATSRSQISCAQPESDRHHRPEIHAVTGRDRRPRRR